LSRPISEEQITKLDLYNDGLSGGADSFKKRKLFCEMLNLPVLSANALLETVNILMNKAEYKNIQQNIQKNLEK